jgi:3-hydroxyacyl-CoA dehydrogenase / enoyl-CoA hydratase / 3-hydroxybutyryl-CoA epimerase
MAFTDKNIHATLDEDGVLLARIDMPGRAMNVFSMDMMDSLAHLLDYVDATAEVKATVITSGKPTFLVGADLEMIRMFTREARTASFGDLHTLCGRLGRLFRRLEKSSTPYVAAINGLALGGGLEVTLACHERVVTNDKAVQLGLPEIKLGLLPGAGGTQRLPRLIGTGEAMRMLLTGEAVTASRALELGLVHELVAPENLIEAAKRRALAMVSPAAPWDEPGRSFDTAPFDFSATDAFAKIAAFVGVSASQCSRYPAYDAIMKCVTDGWNRPMDEACHWEMDVFVDLIRDPVAGNMVRTLFLNRQRAVKEGQAPKSLSDARVAVVGQHADAIARILAKGKAPVIDATALTGTDIVVVLPDAKSDIENRISWLGNENDALLPAEAPGGFWLAEPTEHGLAAEVLVQDGDDARRDVGRKLAQWLRATVVFTSGRKSLLQRLMAARDIARRHEVGEDDISLAVALAAAQAWQDGDVPDVESADVAAVMAGFHPAYTGGPFTYLRQLGADQILQRATRASQRESTLFAVPKKFDQLLRKLDEVA